MNPQAEDPRWGVGPSGRRSLLVRISLVTLAVLGAHFFTSPPAAVADARETPALARTGAGSATGQQVVREALKYEGVPFVLGGPAACIPGWQMDCTCLTTTVFGRFGLELPDLPAAVPYHGAPVYGPALAGDVHVWGPPGDGTGGHVAIDMGDGNIIHANTGTMSTSVTPMYRYMYEDPNYLGAWRLVY